MDTNKLMKEVRKKIKDIQGFIKLKKTDDITFLIVGEVYTSEKNANSIIEELAMEVYPNYGFVNALVVNNKLTVSIDDEITSSRDNSKLDQVKVIFQGYIPTFAVVENGKHRIKSINDTIRIQNVVKLTEFLDPIILDSNLKVIDGDTRLEIAKNLKMKTIPVTIIDDCGVKSEFLRLALNRSTQFQRWNFFDVDETVDSMPQAQPLLEPLGFFGNKLLPESFFADSLLTYKIDVFNDQQSQYSQESTIEDWAKLRKAEIEAAQKEKMKLKNKKPKQTVSLFDLVPSEDDFVETYEILDELEAHKDIMKEVAEKATNNYDKVRKAEMEKKGIKWQNTRRETWEVAEEKRNEFIESLSEYELTEDEIEDVMAHIDTLNTQEELKVYIEELKGK